MRWEKMGIMDWCPLLFLLHLPPFFLLLGGEESAGRGVRLGEVQRADHHDGGPKWVAGTLEVVPLDTVELAYVLPLGEVHAVQVRRSARIKPPACQEEGGRMEGIGGLRGRGRRELGRRHHLQVLVSMFQVSNGWRAALSLLSALCVWVCVWVCVSLGSVQWHAATCWWTRSILRSLEECQRWWVAGGGLGVLWENVILLPRWHGSHQSSPHSRCGCLDERETCTDPELCQRWIKLTPPLNSSLFVIPQNLMWDSM